MILQIWSLRYQMAVDWRTASMPHKRLLQPTPHLHTHSSPVQFIATCLRALHYRIYSHISRSHV